MIKMLFVFVVLCLILWGILYAAYKAVPETRWKVMKYVLIGTSVCGMAAIILSGIVLLF